MRYSNARIGLIIFALYCDATTAQSPDPSQVNRQQSRVAAAATSEATTIPTTGSPYKGRIKWLQPSLQGTTGLFNTFSAEGLRKGEFSLQLGVSNYDRDPGDLDITDFPVAFTVGLADRLEWSLGWIAQRRVDADNIRVFQTPPWGPVRPTRLAVAGSPIGYYNQTPFLDVPFGAGVSDLFSSVKFNLMSEQRGQPFGVAIRANVKVPSSRHQPSLTSGRTTGVMDGGVEFLASKYVGPATVMLNTGVQGVGEHTGLLELQNEYRYGAGVAVGTHPIQAIFEVNGTVWFGDKGRSDLSNPRSPVDLTAGLRFLPGKLISLGVAYRYNARTWPGETFGARSTDRSGFLATLAINRKINRPPTVECTVDNTTIQQRGHATVKVRVNDPDDSQVSITWRSTGGHLIGKGESVTFETGNLLETAPGRYAVRAEVSDGTSTATCSVDVVVEKLKIAPTVTCDPTTQTVKMGETASVRVTASDENPGDTEKLTYVWEVDGQRVAEAGTTFGFGTTGKTPGRHVVRVTATDPDGLTATCESAIEVSAPPPPPQAQANRAPVCDLSLSTNNLLAGSALSGTVRASDPDGDPLTYEWSIDGRRLSGTGQQLDIDTNGLTGGSHTIVVKVSDNKGGSVSCSSAATIRGRVVIELPKLRIDNAAKAKLDDIALQLQNDSRLRTLITGYDVAPNSRIAQRNGIRVAQLAKDYLIKQHKIDPGRIEVKSGGQSTPRRIELEIMSP